jgi:hypothetical protein
MSQFTVNPADERSIQVLVAERQDRVRATAQRYHAMSARRTNAITVRRALGQQVVRLGAWISGATVPQHAPLEAS